ncbi:hypothetical protein BC477_01480 [Clavibacter michiganensis subsp. michiganensis]|uniref:Uncharacterized protein n=1 Tax=Clavibacter michiganensis subsp. michiganensis TaxID=33013 RepID=A0A251XK18_CLAMM|nr:hypothetical protein BC477_01480 [Clavibacter michiganensis subsp. michiganensis]OUE03378.1 hypothetical protein CMMCAS07_00415 [Clavibacter michiganensis subsp. michiganensis]
MESRSAAGPSIRPTITSTRASSGTKPARFGREAVMMSAVTVTLRSRLPMSVPPSGIVRPRSRTRRASIESTRPPWSTHTRPARIASSTEVWSWRTAPTCVRL